MNRRCITNRSDEGLANRAPDIPAELLALVVRLVHKMLSEYVTSPVYDKRAGHLRWNRPFFE